MLSLGLVGHPLGHSLSPVLHRELLRQAGLEGSYELFEITPENLLSELPRRVKEKNLVGFNVTIPYKADVLSLLNTQSEEVRVLQAVNTIRVTPQGWEGFNTDVAGFVSGFPAGALPCHVVILGAGGAARAAGLALLKLGATRLSIHGRNLGRTAETCDLLQALSKGVPVVAVENLTLDFLSTVDWIIQTTPQGMQGEAEDKSPLTQEQVAALPEAAGVYDLVYRPLETPLLKLAKARGLRTVDGLHMLIGQGIESFSLWSGLPASTFDAAQLRAKLLAV